MEVVLAKSLGFCFGVKRAVETVYGQTGNAEDIYTYGAVVNNEEVVEDLKKKGVKVVGNREELKKVKKGTVIIRAHGVAREIYEQIEAQGLKVVDATCPFVKRIHEIVARESAAGKRIVVAGNPGHPEVEGIVGWSKTPAVVLESVEDAQNYTQEDDKEICMVSQTTISIYS